MEKTSSCLIYRPKSPENAFVGADHKPTLQADRKTSQVAQDLIEGAKIGIKLLSGQTTFKKVTRFKD